MRSGLLLVLCLPAFAQTYGEISGTIRDSSQAVLSGARVTVTKPSTGQSREVVSNDAGLYSVPFLTPGSYDLSVELSGFKRERRQDVNVQVDTPQRIDFALQLGMVSETIEVSGTLPLLATDNAAVGTVIDRRRIVEMPLNGRNWLQMVALAPNVSAEMRASGHVDSRQGGERGRQAIAIAGQRQFFNRYTLDGVENTDVNYMTYVIRPSVDAMEEFKIQTGIYSAEFGRATSQINATTKAGDNQYHAALFHFLRNDILDAKEWRLDAPRNPFRRNQFGYVATGRLIRNRLFFMSNYEGLRDVKTLQGTANVAPDSYRSGDLGGQTRAIFDPDSRVFALQNGVERAVSATPFPNRRIPVSRLHPAALKLLEFYPRATVPGENINRNFVRQRPRTINGDQFTQRLDWVESSKSQWFGRFSWGSESETRLETFRQQEGSVVTATRQAMISNTRVLSPSIVNEFRFGINHFKNDLLLHFANVRDVTSELGIRGLVPPIESAWGTPSISLGQGLSGFGESGNGPWINRNAMLQALNNVSILRGKHTFRFGAEVRRDRYNQIGNTVPRGRFGFEPNQTADPASRATTGHAFADLLLGEVRRSERALGLANAQLRATSYYFYGEDTWRITPRLTINAGLRYELSQPWHDRYRGIVNVQLFGWNAGAPTPILTRPGAGDFNEGLEFRFADGIPTQTGDDKLGRSLIYTDKNDFAPRLGIAWNPSDRFTLRFGGGLFYTQDQGNPRFDMARNLAGRGDFSSSDQRSNSRLDDPWRFERQAFPCTGYAGNCVGIPFVLGNMVNRRTPLVYQWLVNIQRQVGRSLVVEAGYLGNAGIRLERLRSMNEAAQRTGPTDTRPIQQRRPFPIYGIIQQVDGISNSSYHALNLKVQQRLARGLSFLSGYTWSKAIDFGSGIRTSSGENSIAMNDYDYRPERGLSQFHTGHRWVNSLLYAFPKIPGVRGVAGYVLNGWETSSILTFSTGNPLRVGSIGDTNSIGGDGNYPDATGLSATAGAGTIENFWNLNAFDARNPELTWRFGNSARNTLLSPGYAQWDFALTKQWRLRESHSLQFRWESFNFSNHPNWNPPSADVRNAATFGKVQTARTMREMQFALKYNF